MEEYLLLARERIHNCPFHANLEIVAFKVRPNLLQNLGIIVMEKKHSPIKSQKLVSKIKNGHNIVLIAFIPHRNLLGIGNQWIRKVPRNIDKNKISFVLKINLHM